MISIRKINALYQKNMKNMISNSYILLPLILVVAIAFLFTMQLDYDATNEDKVTMLAILVGMSLMTVGATTMAILISEEKEKHTLGVLITSTVSGLDFLISNVLTSLTVIIVANIAIYYIVPAEGLLLTDFLLVTSVGAVAAITLGAIMGLLAKNQAAASTMLTPLLLLPVIPAFFADNFFVDNVLYYMFTEQMGVAMSGLIEGGISWSSAGIMTVNIVVFAIIFGIFYRKSGLAA